MKIYLSLALHNHQPVGNFGWVFQEAFDKSYLPLLECLERHPTIRIALHYTGPLRDWIWEQQPTFFPRLRKLVETGQIEIMTGAYYEPVLVSLRDDDKLGQIKKLTESVKSDFDYDATGFWLAERIWEPHLPKSLAEAGVNYTIVDDTHFKAVGLTDTDLFGYYVTEEQGSSINVFGTSMALRYSIPWKPVHDVIDWLQALRDEGGDEFKPPLLAIMGDDGEKFGMWPGTYEHVWEKGWMDSFFTAIEANSSWLETIPPGEFVAKFASIGRVYLPTSSYDEMGEWSLPPERAFELHHVKQALAHDGRNDALQFIRGGLWRSFMVKYSEVNQLHKKALWVSDKVHRMGDGLQKSEALSNLWAGQCNCGYWHGTFGGIYLFHIREADYRHLLVAENLADGIGATPPTRPFVKVDRVDFDRDGASELIISTDHQIAIVSPVQGGVITEWDYRAAQYNLLNVMTRRREGHHQTLIDAAKAGAVITPDTAPKSDTESPRNIHSEEVRAREPGLDQKLIYDSYRRASFIDHFFDSNATIESFYRAELWEQGDFANAAYDYSIDQGSSDNCVITLTRTSTVNDGQTSAQMKLTKSFKWVSGSTKFLVSYNLSTEGRRGQESRFGVEVNFGLAGGNDAHTTFNTSAGTSSLGDTLEDSGLQGWNISSQLWKIQVAAKASRKFTVWRFPLETISLSEGGFERNYQGTAIMMWWPLHLNLGENWDVELEFDLSRTESS